MVLTAQTYEEFALADPERKWELYDGKLREKPPMTARHSRLMYGLDRQLMFQLDGTEYEIRIDSGRARHSSRNYFMPDVMVVPVAVVESLMDLPNRLDLYIAPVPFIAEVWSPSTGDCDVEDKLPLYQERGDLEIWRVHPLALDVIAWRRQPDGSYTTERFAGGRVALHALPNVTIDLDQLFGLVTPK